MTNIIENPFSVTTPENLPADKAVKLFVDVFSDFPKILNTGHLFLNGPRGSGKSMIFRFVQPDCQCIYYNCKLHELPFYSIYFPVKNTDLNITEFSRLDGMHASTILNEHFMTMTIAESVFKHLSEYLSGDTDVALMKESKDVSVSFLNLLYGCGLTKQEDTRFEGLSSINEFFRELASICEGLFRQFITYLKRLSFPEKPLPYDGPLCGYLDFLYPLLCNLKNLSFMPDGPIYLLIDDADNLNLTQTKILNSWVSSRTSSNVSLKISTQLQYKSYRTTTGQTITAPHDFSEINISTIYTSRKGTYFDRVKEIVLKRLKISKIDSTPEEFFPCDKEQELKIDEIAEEYRRNWKKKGRGNRPSDDALRYSRPDFIKNLSGMAKSRHSYSYSGFNQLVHVSSGVVRYFLEAATQMYSDTQAESEGRTVQSISPRIQNHVVRKLADEFLHNEFEKLLGEEDIEPSKKDLLTKLFNLIKALGGTFGQILLSDRSERRVFSIAFTDEPNETIRQVLKIGEHLGYFHISAIGNKDGTGRTPLYILNRRLAPYFNLDPTGFAGYLFVKSESIIEAMERPNALLRRVKAKGAQNVFEESRQLKLFE